MGIFSIRLIRQLNASRRAPRPYLTHLSLTLVSLSSRFASAAVSTTGNVLPDPNTTTTTDELYVGQSADGGMVVDRGSSVDSGASYVGYDSGVSGTVSITGATSAWNARSLAIGHSGTGELIIANGGMLAVSQLSRLGNLPGSTGSAIVNGNPSHWSSAILEIGNFGDGELAISDGGAIQAGTISVGRQSDSDGTLTISGQSSTISGQILRVGDAGRGQLVIADRSLVITSSLGEIGTGTQSNSSAHGTVTVSGSGSSWINHDTLGIGARGKGELTIADGGLVTCDHCYIAVYDNVVPNEAGSEGTVIVEGNDSMLRVVDTLSIGGVLGQPGGTGTLIVRQGGTLLVGETAYISRDGKLVLEGGSLDADVINFRSALGGEGQFDWISGKLRVAHFGRSLVNTAGILTPGEGIGSTTIDGSYTQEIAATVEIEIDGPEEGEYDTVMVDGIATLGGTLDVRPLAPAFFARRRAIRLKFSPRRAGL